MYACGRGNLGRWIMRRIICASCDDIVDSRRIDAIAFEQLAKDLTEQFNGAQS
jgi:hypothetical protein